MEYILSTDNLKFLDNIVYPEINIIENKMTFINGESGVGKTSLFKLFNATASPSEGKIYYKGRDISEIDTISLRRGICLVSQEPYLFKGSVLDNFNTYYSFRGDSPPDKDTILRLLSICCINLSLDKDCSFLSGGERQRLFTAIFLSFSPKILLLDEPTSALDELNANRFIANIKEYCQEKGITPIIISHDKSLVNKFADYIITLERGRSL